MVVHALRWGPRPVVPRDGAAGRDDAFGRDDAAGRGATRVAVDADGPTWARLRDLATTTGAFDLVDEPTSAPLHGADVDVDVVVVSLSDEDSGALERLRRDQRAGLRHRTVVIGRGVTWFDAAFGAGADAWIDHTADDATVLAAISGRWA